jgi:hypothetical protein
MPKADATAQSSGKNKNRMEKKKAGGNNNKLLTGAPTTTAAASGGRGPQGDKQPRQPSDSDEGSPWCLVHNSRHHSSKEFQEIKKLVEQFHKQ